MDDVLLKILKLRKYKLLQKTIVDCIFDDTNELFLMILGIIMALCLCYTFRDTC